MAAMEMMMAVMTRMVLVMEMATKLSKHYSPSLRPLPVWVVVAKGAFQVGLQTICSEVSDAK